MNQMVQSCIDVYDIERTDGNGQFQTVTHANLKACSKPREELTTMHRKTTVAGDSYF